jgi:hypothetical protein
MPRTTITVHGDGLDAVFVAEDGSKLEGVFDAVIRMHANEPTIIELEMFMPRSIIKGAVTEVNFPCPVCEDTVHHECKPNTLSGT